MADRSASRDSDRDCRPHAPLAAIAAAAAAAAEERSSTKIWTEPSHVD
jgi:hypothetical protein